MQAKIPLPVGLRRRVVRKAKRTEFEAIFRMGFDVWSGVQSLEQYLASCHASPKYKKGQWHVLACDGQLLSSLIVYELSKDAAGIGSIATPSELRGRGYASQLINEIVLALEAGKAGRPIFLFADIAPEFCGRFGFISLPKRYQTCPGSVCMVRAANLERLLKDLEFVPPPYF